jgi:hypothetical protein
VSRTWCKGGVRDSVLVSELYSEILASSSSRETWSTRARNCSANPCRSPSSTLELSVACLDELEGACTSRELFVRRNDFGGVTPDSADLWFDSSPDNVELPAESGPAFSCSLRSWFALSLSSGMTAIRLDNERCGGSLLLWTKECRTGEGRLGASPCAIWDISTGSIFWTSSGR